jgi:hypothetical protein
LLADLQHREPTIAVIRCFNLKAELKALRVVGGG